LIMRDRIINPPDGKKRNSKIILHFRVTRIDFHGFFIMNDCVINPALLYQKPPQVVMRFRISRPQGNGMLIMIDRLINVALVPENDAEIVMRHPATRVFPERCCVQSDQIPVFGSVLPREERQQNQKRAAKAGAWNKSS